MQERTDARQPEKTPLATMGLAVVALASVFGPSVAAAQEIFADDFESGDISEWSADVGYEPDSEAPALELVSPGLSELAEGSLPAIMLAYSDPGSGVDTESLRVEVDASDVTSTCTIGSEQASCPMPALALGGHSLAVALSDRAGNPAELSFAFTVVADSLVPRPRITILRPGPSVIGDATPEIEVAWANGVSDTLSVELDGSDLSASCTVSSGSALCEAKPLASGEHELRAEIRNSAGVAGSALVLFDLQLGIQVTIESPENGHLTRDDTVTLRGSVGPEATEVVVAGVLATLDGAGGWEVSDLPLKEGANPLSATARRVVAGVGSGGVGTAVVTVVKDTEAPRIVLRGPGAGTVVTQSTVLVTGEVADPVSSSFVAQAPRVTVNGIEAEVEHKSFLVENFLLQRGENRIVATAQDSAGNVGRTELVVQHDPDALRKIEEVQGNAQRGVAGETLGQPLVVRLVDRIGNPLPNRPVTFRVTRGDGAVVAYPKADEQLVVLSDERGLAQVRFALGRRSGVGNQEVAAEAEGFAGTVVFCASAAAALPERIKPIPGNDHSGATTGEVGQPLPRPLYAQVFDENGNPVPDLLVSWEVVEGGGTLKNGTPIATSRTDAEGKATMTWVLGPDTEVNGQQVIASFAGLDESPAIFVATAKNAGSEAQTAIVGFVTDNQDEPMNKVRVEVENTALWAETGPDGRFRIDSAPVGEVHLLVNGTTTDREGIWARLAFEMSTVPGIDNDLGMPIRLLPLSESSDSRKIVGGDKDVTLSLEGVPGAELTVRANSVTFPDGSPTGELSVTQVHSDKVPMVPPLGSSFMLAWTIQPPGVKFDPPARIAIPNFGDPPGTVVDIYSFDHDLGEFLSIGTATVSEDGTQLASDPGFGVVKSGWHGCLPPPPPTADSCRAGTCRICVEGSKKTVPKCDECSICNGGDCVPRRIEALEVEARVGQGEWQTDGVTVGRGKDVSLRSDLEGSCAARSVYEWDFGDGSSGSGQSVVHAFAEEGLYRVRLEVRCDGCPQAGTVSEEIIVRVGLLDLTLQDLPEETELEPNEEIPGALIFVNDDDDDLNGTADLEESVGSEDDELVRATLGLSSDAEGELTLSVDGDSGAVRLWEDRAKTRAIVLPKTWVLAEELPPADLWLEGRQATSAASVETWLSLALTLGAAELAVDRVRLEVLQLSLVASPVESGTIGADVARTPAGAAAFLMKPDDTETPVDDGSLIEFEVTQGTGSLESLSVATEDGFATTVFSLPTSPGAQGAFKAILSRLELEDRGFTDQQRALRYVAPSGTIRIAPGPPAGIALAATTSQLAADNHDTLSIVAEIRDTHGNPVAEGTGVVWSAGPLTMVQTADVVTTGGRATAVLRSFDTAGTEVIRVDSHEASGSLSLTTLSLGSTLAVSPPVLTLGTEEMAQVTLLASASDGAPVEWFTSNGTLADQTNIVGGRATATLTTEEGSAGKVVVLAKVGFEQSRWIGEFRHGSDLSVSIEPPLLIADDAPLELLSSRGVVGAELTSTTLFVKGAPGGVARVVASGTEIAEAYTFESSSAESVPGVVAGTPMSLSGALVSQEQALAGEGSLRLDIDSMAVVDNATLLDFQTEMHIEFWFYPSSAADGNLLGKGNAWGVELASDGRLRGWIGTTTGPIELVTTGTVESGQWNRIGLSASITGTRLSLNEETVLELAPGQILVNGDDLVLGGSVEGYLDELAIYSAVGGLSMLSMVGVDAAGQVVLDEEGSAEITLASLGVGDLVYEEIRRVEIGVGVLPIRRPLDGTNGTLRALQARADFAFVKDVVVFTSKGMWEDGRGVILAIWGADTEGGTQFSASIVGGFLGTADVGALFKNLWRLAGRGEGQFNKLEVFLSLVGIATTVVPAVDPAVSALRNLAQRIGDSPLLEALYSRFLAIVVEGRPLFEGEMAFYQRLAGGLDEAASLKNLIDEDSLEGFIKMERAFLQACARGQSETEVAARAASGTRAAGCLPGALAALEELPLEQVRPLLEELWKLDELGNPVYADAWDQMRKAGPRMGELLTNMVRVSSKVSPFYAVKLARNCEFVCAGAYPITKLFDDLVEISDIQGFAGLAKRVAIRNKQSVGFRYELEVAIDCKSGGGQLLAFVDFGVEVILEGDKAWTDIDVGCEIDGKTILYQAKRTAKAFSSRKGKTQVDKVDEWLVKARQWLFEQGQEGEIRYAVPDEAIVPDAVRQHFAGQIPEVVLDTISSVPAWFD